MLLLLILTAQAFPYPDVLEAAETRVALSRALSSDDLDIYRYTWSFFITGPCRNKINFSDDRDSAYPCSARPFFQSPDDIQLPSVLYTAYEKLAYTAPTGYQGKASLSLAWTYALVSAGVIWEMTANSEGIKQDIFLCEYKPKRREILLPGVPPVPITVTFLKPAEFQHFTLQANGNYNLQTHHMNDWATIFSFLQVGTLYDVHPNVPVCGTPSYIYTTKPAETLMEITGALVPDGMTLTAMDQQLFTTPMLGYRGCGEFAYAPWHLFMTHRAPLTPSNYNDGPPLEIWNFSGGRDIAESTNQVLGEDQPSHGQVAATREALREVGIAGEITTDPDMKAALAEQARVTSDHYKKSADYQAFIYSLMMRLGANTDNDMTAMIYLNMILPHLRRGDPLDHLWDSQIEFDPFAPHCDLEPAPGTLPFLGWEFFAHDPPEYCPSCDYHNQILAEPARNWNHQRLLAMKWFWEPIHGEHGNLYEQAHAYIRSFIYSIPTGGEPIPSDHARKSLTDTQQDLAALQRQYAHNGQAEEITLADLEETPSVMTTNRATSATQDTIPLLFQQPYDRCLDPSYTIQYLLLFGELTDIFDAPCGLLWDVEH